jgi:hypothetical protein
LHAITEAAKFCVSNAIAGGGDFVPKVNKGAHLAQLGHKADACVHKERDATDHGGEFSGRYLGAQVIEHGAGGGKGEGQLLFRCSSRLLQVI